MATKSARGLFVKQALRNPGAVGAVWPSSRQLAETLAKIVPTRGNPIVAELGAGTGSACEAIDERLPEGGRHFAVEIDPSMAEHLEREYPSVTVLRGDAADLGKLLAEHGVDELDAIVCGLPWSIFGDAKQRAILGEIRAMLPKHGFFATFTYRHTAILSGARRFRALLEENFDQVHISRTVVRNVPPAYVYLCSGRREVEQ
ncbi:class I SAM-dependent methyltransferase [Sciscionella sediminilitoris]|uniref:class I SAM-dependent methyltransferase n=1 Tax=Sciscionella sediminilitoris TaxID=1445613 RepID=UPI0004DED24F|nr:methyltransferase domain-containing protein [Sciscionella sp. SE31]